MFSELKVQIDNFSIEGIDELILALQNWQRAVNTLFERERSSVNASGQIGLDLADIGLCNLVLWNEMQGLELNLAEGPTSELPERVSWIARDLQQGKAALERLYGLVEGLNGPWADQLRADIERLLE